MSNGQAERFVDTFKRALKKLDGEGTVDQNLKTFLQCYRSTPNRNAPDGKSPAEILHGRKMRIPLNAVKPKVNIETQLTSYQQEMKNQFDSKHGTKDVSYNWLQYK